MCTTHFVLAGLLFRAFQAVTFLQIGGIGCVGLVLFHITFGVRRWLICRLFGRETVPLVATLNALANNTIINLFIGFPFFPGLRSERIATHWHCWRQITVAPDRKPG